MLEDVRGLGNKNSGEIRSLKRWFVFSFWKTKNISFLVKDLGRITFVPAFFVKLIDMDSRIVSQLDSWSRSLSWRSSPSRNADCHPLGTKYWLFSLLVWIRLEGLSLRLFDSLGSSNGCSKARILYLSIQAFYLANHCPNFRFRSVSISSFPHPIRPTRASVKAERFLKIPGPGVHW